MESPKLSVIVVSLNTPAVLSRCLGALTGSAPAGSRVEIVAVGDWPVEDDSFAQVRAAFRTVTWIDAPGSTVPQRRSLGIERTQGEIVALLEDDCVAADGWCRSVLRAHESPAVAIGGAIAPGNCAKSLDWAVYFCEYSRFMPPFAGPVDALPGNNVSYKRAALIELDPSGSAKGFYETFFHWKLQESGRSLLADPALAVTNVNSWGYVHVLGVPFHHGRSFAGLRVDGRRR
jgi:hypothetical protein